MNTNLQQILPLPELPPRRRSWNWRKRTDGRQTWLKSSELFELQHAGDLVSFEVTTQGLKAPPHDFLPQVSVVQVTKLVSELSSKVAFHSHSRSGDSTCHFAMGNPGACFTKPFGTSMRNASQQSAVWIDHMPAAVRIRTQRVGILNGQAVWLKLSVNKS